VGKGDLCDRQPTLCAMLRPRSSNIAVKLDKVANATLSKPKVFMDNIKEISFNGFYFHHTVEHKPMPAAFSRHCHNMYEVIFFLEGEGEFLVEGSRYALLPNSLLLLRPREFHYMNISPNTTYERYVVHFSSELLLLQDFQTLLEPFDNRIAGQGNLYYCKDMTNAISQLFIRLADYSCLPEDEKIMLSKCILSELLVLVLGIFRRRDETLTLPKSDLGIELIAYLNENITRPIHLEQLAEQFFVSKYYLSHIFKNCTGISIMDYVIRKRVKMAQSMISNGIPAAKAAQSCGFGDYTSFFRAYKRIIGASPSTKIIKHQDI